MHQLKISWLVNSDGTLVKGIRQVSFFTRGILCTGRGRIRKDTTHEIFSLLSELFKIAVLIQQCSLQKWEPCFVHSVPQTDGEWCWTYPALVLSLFMGEISIVSTVLPGIGEHMLLHICCPSWRCQGSHSLPKIWWSCSSTCCLLLWIAMQPPRAARPAIFVLNRWELCLLCRSLETVKSYWMSAAL